MSLLTPDLDLPLIDLFERLVRDDGQYHADDRQPAIVKLPFDHGNQSASHNSASE